MAATYKLDLDSEEKKLIQNALINLRFSQFEDAAYDLDELIERFQDLRPERSIPSYESR